MIESIAQSSDRCKNETKQNQHQNVRKWWFMFSSNSSFFFECATIHEYIKVYCIQVFVSRVKSVAYRKLKMLKVVFESNENCFTFRKKRTKNILFERKRKLSSKGNSAGIWTAPYSSTFWTSINQNKFKRSVRLRHVCRMPLQNTEWMNKRQCRYYLQCSNNRIIGVCFWWVMRRHSECVDGVDECVDVDCVNVACVDFTKANFDISTHDMTQLSYRKFFPCSF